MYRLILSIFFLFLAMTALAQQGRYSETVDKKTYDLYMKSDFDEVIDAGESAIDSGIDFYYLRMRLGISFYQKENYMSAIQHFQKAVEFTPKDTIALEYLYYSYLFSAQESEANLLAENLPASLKRKIGYKAPSFFKGAYTEGGYSFDNNYNSITNNNTLSNQDFAVTQNILKDQTYLNLSLLHSIGSRVSIFHGYNNIVVNSLRQYTDGFSGKNDFDASVKQNEYYFNLGIYLGKEYSLTAAIHYLNVRLYDVAAPDSLSHPYRAVTTTSNQFVQTIGISKRIGHTEVGYSALLSNLNGGKQIQNTFTFVWYPFGNLNLYNVSNLVFHSNKANDSSDNVTRFIFDEKLGFRLSGKLWMEAVLTVGNIFNYSEGNAFIVYNNLDKIKYKAGFNIISPLSKNVELSFRYLILSQQYYIMTTNTGFITTTKTNNLLNHKLIGGIKWTF